MSNVARGWLALWFGLQRPVSRRAYALSGFGLMALKYAVDALIVGLATRRLWSPLDYLSPLIGARQAELGQIPDEIQWVLVLWTLPFLWIGLSMSIRRAADAGYTPWLAFAYLVPFLNYALMLCLALLPSDRSAVWRTAGRAGERAQEVGSVLMIGLASVSSGVATALVSLGFAVYLLGEYGVALFAWTPLVMGAVSGFALNRRGDVSIRATLAVAALTCAASGAGLLLFAFEGLMCVLMALPIAVPLALAGALAGRAIALRTPCGPRASLLGIAALAGSAALAPAHPEAELREVATSVEVDAPPELVWPSVVAFPEIPPPPPGLFRTGIAVPLRARVDGEGVGAVRHCEFSTGEFLEPITVWDAPRRLAFDVIAEPRALVELTPWEGVHPPHLDHYFSSKRGEFRLVPLPGGRTRLEGSTWYALDVHPRGYWRLWADAIVHRIHRRVLEHVRDQAELAATRQGPAR